MSTRSLRRGVRNLSLTLFTMAGISSIPPAALAQNAPREFTGKIGENEFATSDAGLQPNEKVRLNGQDDLSKTIRGHDEACVYSVTLTAAPGGRDQYILTVDGQGPQKAQGNLYLEFVDAARDTPVRYGLVLSPGKRATQTLPLRPGGQKPVIKVIKWSNTPFDN